MDIATSAIWRQFCYHYAIRHPVSKAKLAVNVAEADVSK